MLIINLIFTMCYVHDFCTMFLVWPKNCIKFAKCCEKWRCFNKCANVDIYANKLMRIWMNWGSGAYNLLIFQFYKPHVKFTVHSFSSYLVLFQFICTWCDMSRVTCGPIRGRVYYLAANQRSELSVTCSGVLQSRKSLEVRIFSARMRLVSPGW